MLHGLGSRNSVRLSVCHTRAMWQHQTMHCGYFGITEKSNHSSFVTPAGYRAPSLKRTSHVAMCYERGIARFLSAMRVFEVRASSSSPGYLCANFFFCRGPCCWASPWRKMAYSVTHSPSLFDAPGTEAFALEKHTNAVLLATRACCAKIILKQFQIQIYTSIQCRHTLPWQNNIWPLCTQIWHSKN